MMRRREEHERHQRHPAKEAELEAGERDEVRFRGRHETVLDAEAPHRRDREVLEHNPQRESEGVVAEIFRQERAFGNREREREDQPFGDQVTQRASGPAVAHLDRRPHRPGLRPSERMPGFVPGA